MDLYKEFDRQVSNLIELNYPKLLNQTHEVFNSTLSGIMNKIESSELTEVDFETGTLPFVIVVKSNLVTPEKAMSLVNRNGKEGVVKLLPHTSQDFSNIKEVNIPSSDIYVLLNIDRGKKTINIAPKEALKSIQNENRSPLTIDEGVAIITHFPNFLVKNNCFSLLASRNIKDKRVPAIWINSNNNPNLGWCWEGNPHTWLGSASCEHRVGL